jgi:hypothetical protein
MEPGNILISNVDSDRQKSFHLKIPGIVISGEKGF